MSIWVGTITILQHHMKMNYNFQFLGTKSFVYLDLCMSEPALGGGGCDLLYDGTYCVSFMKGTS